jgi:Cys-tRNA synthase (O-phospho-L-seryl-tRNA:Cys-tRNA synthase)
MTTEQLLDAVDQLSCEELEGIVQLEARRREPALSKRETELLRQINTEASPDRLSRYHELREKRKRGELTDPQQQELVQLSDWIEEVHAERMAYVAELACLRGLNLSQMTGQLGIQHWAD